MRSLVLIVIATINLSARADNWPEFRGPGGDGIVLKGSLPTEWGPKKNIAWKKPIPGSGWSSPTIVDGKIYLTTSVLVDKMSKDRSLRALCLDAKTGDILWDEEVFKQNGAKAANIHGKNSHASPTALVKDGRVYVHFGHDGTAALDLKGKVLWKTTEHDYWPVHGNGGSPIVVDKALVYSGDGSDKQFVVALNRDDGTLLWKTPRNTTSKKKFAFSTPMLIDVKGQKQIVSPGPGIVAAYEPIKGEEIWRVNYGEGYSVVPRPVFGHGLVFLSSGYDSPVLYAIRTDGTGDVTQSHVAWTMKKGAPLTPSPLLVGDELYTISDGGIASCLDAKTGAVHWQERVGGAHSSSPIFADGKIYYLAEDGAGTVVKTGKTYELISRNEMNEKTLASYGASEGDLFLRTEKNLYRIHQGK